MIGRLVIVLSLAAGCAKPKPYEPIPPRAGSGGQNVGTGGNSGGLGGMAGEPAAPDAVAGMGSDAAGGMSADASERPESSPDLVMDATPAPPKLVEYALPTTGARPTNIALGGDNNMWFTEAGAGSIARITSDGKVTEFPLSDATSEPWGIAEDRLGFLWFTERGAGKIGRITYSGLINEYQIPGGGRPYDITLGPDGFMYYMFQDSTSISRITSTGLIEQYVTGYNFLTGIAAGSDGGIWATTQGPRLVRIEGATTGYGEFPLNGASGRLIGISRGPEDSLWMLEPSANKVWQRVQGRDPRAYAIPTADAQPARITAARDGTIWFTESAADRIGRISSAGAVEEYALPQGSRPHGIAMGADGSVWFCQSGTNRIGRLMP